MTQGAAVDLHAITEGGRASGVEHGEVLVELAEAMVSRDAGAIARARQRVIDAMGVEAMVDAAAVASNFERMVRIADGTDIPLGVGLESRSRAVVTSWGSSGCEALGAGSPAPPGSGSSELTGLAAPRRSHASAPPDFGSVFRCPSSFSFFLVRLRSEHRS